MSGGRFSDPEELERLAPDELRRRAVPLLRQGGLAPTPAVLRHHLESVPLASVELVRAWRARPYLGERKVSFEEFYAARLCTWLREIDQKQRPGLYDGNRGYHPDREPVPLDEEVPTGPVAEDTPESFASALVSARIDVASQAGALTFYDALLAGQITNGRRAGAPLGRGAATSVHQAGDDYLAELAERDTFIL
jgi:hypothetical protein